MEDARRKENPIAFRNWQERDLRPRNQRLAALSSPNNYPVRFCPRCGSSCGWHTDAEAAQQHDFKPIQDDYYCSACGEHFEVKSVPSPYGGVSGWIKRRRVAVAQLLAGR